ncbi:unnamed protein product [Prunus armeniaca]
MDTERFDTSVPLWILHVDGSANQQGCGAGLVLTTPNGSKIKYALRFDFRTSNNEVEYKALLASLRLAQSMSARQISYYYKKFQAYEIRQIPRSENSHADALSRLASAINDKIGRKVPVEILSQPSTTDAEDANILVRRCDKCQRLGSVPHIPAEPLSPIVSPWPFAQRGLDLIGPMPEGKGQVKYAVVAVDYFTKWVEAKALATITAARVEDFVWTNICCRFGIPYAIVTDNGRQFDSEVFREFCTRLNFNMFFGESSTPQSNGQVEAMNKIVKELLKRQLDRAKGAWPEKLPEAL